MKAGVAMTYSEALAAIHSRKAFSTGGPTLDRIRRLLDRLGDPQKDFKSVHVAGTNGKGSVCALVESALRASGFRVGLFTSPYLVEFRERIQVDRVPISEELLTACFEAVMAQETALEQAGFEPVNEFELVTAIGFLAFSRCDVEYAVIEVGLGGRCDATNILPAPEVCCITPISLDHTGVLGNTVTEIAAEKAGIIKPCRPVVLARQENGAMEVLRHEALTQDSPCILTQEPELLRYDIHGILFRYEDQKLSIPLLGRYQMDNAVAAWEVCKALHLPSECAKKGFAHVSWPGRLQYIHGSPDLLIDAGHNPAGIAALCQTLDELLAGREIITVMAMMKDKDHGSCIPMVASRSGALIATSVQLPRSLPPAELAAEAGQFCRTFSASSVVEGIHLAQSMAKSGQLVLVCGSVYAAGEALRTIQ